MVATKVHSNGNGTPMPALAEDQVSNDSADLIALGSPYRVKVSIVGVAPILLHRYSAESVGTKGDAAKGSATKKTDDIESYVYRNRDGHLGIDGVMFAAAIREAGRSEADPRSPRKSMRDILRSLVIPVEKTAPFEPATKTWDYLDRSRVVIQRSAVTRVRPAMNEGWKLTFTLDITNGDYLPPKLLRKLINDAGRYQGLADYRPTYGRFDVVRFDIVTLKDAA